MHPLYIVNPSAGLLLCFSKRTKMIVPIWNVVKHKNTCYILSQIWSRCLIPFQGQFSYGMHGKFRLGKHHPNMLLGKKDRIYSMLLRIQYQGLCRLPILIFDHCCSKLWLRILKLTWSFDCWFWLIAYCYFRGSAFPKRCTTFFNALLHEPRLLWPETCRNTIVIVMAIQTAPVNTSLIRYSGYLFQATFQYIILNYVLTHTQSLYLMVVYICSNNQ